MSADAAPRRRKPRRPAGFAGIVGAMRLHLCAIAEEPEVRLRHVAALLAFTSNVQRSGGRVRFTFEHGPTALWVLDVLGREDAELVDVGGDGGVIDVFRPHMVLGRYGFRDGRWVFGQGMDAALGVSRGAVHAAGAINQHGLKVACPSAPMMLTLTAVLTRLGIAASPTEGPPRTAIRPGDVAGALDRLGLPADVVDGCRRLGPTKDSRGDEVRRDA